MKPLSYGLSSLALLMLVACNTTQPNVPVISPVTQDAPPTSTTATQLTMTDTKASTEATPITESNASNAADMAPSWSGAPIAGLYQCEQGQNFDLKVQDDNNAEITWLKKKYPLNRVTTTTGAVRLEDQKTGLLLVQIPAKNILMNTKTGRQLANECKLATK